MTPRRFQRVCRVLDRRQPDLTVLLDNVHKPHNVAAILRSCDAVGVLEAHAVWPNPRLRPGNHTSGGSRKWVEVRTHRTLEEATEHLHARGFALYAAHLSAGARDYRDVDYTAPSAVVLGAELTGLRREGIDHADEHIVIPMSGMVQSLNVSVAAAVVLFEAQRQRREAGLYERRRLEPEYRARVLFEWLHPEVAAYCRQHGRVYPRLGDDGEIVDFERG